MQSKATRIAYLKRVLKRLEAEPARIKALALSGELTKDGEQLAMQLLERSRSQLESELKQLSSER
jgi:hypothetical protein